MPKMMYRDLSSYFDSSFHKLKIRNNVEEVIAYIGNTYPSFTYDQVKCRRDTGLIVDALAQDLLFQTKSQSTFTGLQYWSKNNYTGNIASELAITRPFNPIGLSTACANERIPPHD